jgi:hypothetical protein
MSLRAVTLALTMMLAGCGTSAPPADMPARTWRYYAAHPAEIEAMQKVCREWAGSGAAAGTEPAVITTNCRAAAFARSQLQRGK